MKSYSVLLFLLIVFLVACNSKDTKKKPNLDHFLDPQPTELVIEFGNVPDSIAMSFSLWQHIAPRYDFDTILNLRAGKVPIELKLALEKPLLAEIQLNGFRDELFLLPGEAYRITCHLEASKLETTFLDETTKKLNTYYDEKAQLIENEDIRLKYSALAASSTYQNVIKAYNSMRDELLALLWKVHKQLELPAWFLDFESKNIESTHLVYSIGLARYQKHLGVDMGTYSAAHHLPDTFWIEDPIAITTDFHMGILEHYLYGRIDSLETVISKRIHFHNLLLEESKVLGNDRFRDIFLAKRYRMMTMSGFNFPDSLTDKYLYAISERHRPYVNSLSEQPPIVGKPAANFYLKDKSGHFVDRSIFENKVILLNFWSATCVPCFKEFSHENYLLEEFDKESFSLVKICMNTKEADWRNILNEYHVGGINLLSNPGWDKKIAKSYKNPAYSQYMLINAKGRIVMDKCPKPSDQALKEMIARQLVSR